jgi:GntR family transcriptional regulator, histidine utilization repressor
VSPVSETLAPARRIEADIADKIRSGEWPPGHRIPVEIELAAQYGCARATANKAIVSLVQAGLVERRRRGGSFVSRPHVQTAVLEIPDIAQVIAARGEAYGFNLLSRAKRPVHGEAEQDLGATGKVLALEGLHSAAGAPFAFEARILNLAAAPEAEAQDFSAQAPGSWLLSHIPWTQARHRITAIAADRSTAKRLDIAPGHPCLQVERWTWRQRDGVTYVRQVFPGDRYDLVAQFTPA